MSRGGPWALLVTCEHGGNRVPVRYRPLFERQETLLASHRGWDAGALPLARWMARTLRAPLRSATVTRLLVDLNRSPGHPRVFSPMTRTLGRAEREELLSRYHAPHREAVDADVCAHLAAGGRVLHLGVHSFTPVLDGEVRRTDLSLLYDPARGAERGLCASWVRSLRRRLPGLAVRRNDPYRGASDGLTTWLRRRHPEGRYLGIEIEVNQRLLGAGGRFPREIGEGLVAGLEDALARGPGHGADTRAAGA